MTRDEFQKIYVKAWNYATDKVGPSDPRCWMDLLADKFCEIHKKDAKRCGYPNNGAWPKESGGTHVDEAGCPCDQEPVWPDSNDCGCRGGVGFVCPHDRMKG